MKNHIQPGHMLTVAAPAGGVSSGDGVLIGQLFGVAAYAAAEGSEVEIATEGVFELTKATGSGAAWTVGAPIFWNASAGKAAKSGDAVIGLAVAAASDSATVGRVKLMPAPATPAAAIADLAADANLATTVAKVNAILAELRTTKVVATS